MPTIEIKPSAHLSSLFLALLLVVNAAQSIRAGEVASPFEQAVELQKKYQSFTSLTFTFTQVTRSGGRERFGAGEAVFVKLPVQNTSGQGKKTIKNVMRWNYTDPDVQVIINDGEILSIYTEKDNQLIKTSAQELESDITYAFFSGTRNLLDDFEALPGESSFIYSSEKPLQTLSLIPRIPHNQIKAIQIWFDAESVIRHMTIEDHFDSVTELNFETIAINSLTVVDQEKMKSIITFPIPPGTEIITQ